MSRVGKNPIDIPKAAKIKIEEKAVYIEGPKGKLFQKIPKGINVDLSEDKVVVTRNSDEREQRSFHGLTRTLIANMLHGVTAGFKKELEIIGVGYRAEKKDKTLTMLLGFSSPIVFQEPEGINIQVNKQMISVEGIDKCLVGQTASKIRSFRKPDVYKGKGIRYVGEIVRKKVGKTGVK
jgi:large subunit ribosomal protein L6